MGFLLVPFKMVWSFLVIATPILGFWLASSLASFLNGPTWAAGVAGALLFPVLPLLWEWRATKRFERRMALRDEKGKKTRKPYLTFWDRFIFRTLVINLGFIAALLAAYPEQSFAALSTRGDWMLEGRQDDTSDRARDVMFRLASGLEWLHNLARENPYEQFTPTDQEDVNPAPNPIPIPVPKPKPEPTPTPDPNGEKPEKQPEPEPGIDTDAWPMEATLHPLVSSMPASVETSIESVAKYILDGEPDARQRVKALNDYVADRVAYDAVALAEGRYPPQDAQTVFKTRKAVWAGYAKLMVELGKHTGDKILYIVGVSREQGGEIAGGGHAWNAAEIDGKWYLIDTTWNAGTVNGRTFTKKYKTDYLFTPPQAFGLNHFPDDEKWQLRPDPIDRGTFVRQPMLRASFFSHGLKLISPNRAQVSVTGDRMVIKLKNPLGRRLSGTIRRRGSGDEERCDIDEGKDAEIVCPVLNDGVHEVVMFAKERDAKGPLWSVGRLEVIR